MTEFQELMIVFHGYVLSIQYVSGLVLGAEDWVEIRHGSATECSSQIMKTKSLSAVKTV